MENYHLVCQWASSLKADKAFEEIQNLKAKHAWLKCDESFQFIQTMYEDLPKMLNIIKIQEKQNAVLRHSEEKLREYIRVNGMADEVILDDLQKKFNIEI